MDWFSRNAENNGLSEDDLLSANFLEAKIIDSLRIVELVVDIETHFDISFTQDQFQDDRFATIQGLAAMVAELRAA